MKNKFIHIFYAFSLCFFFSQHTTALVNSEKSVETLKKVLEIYKKDLNISIKTKDLSLLTQREKDFLNNNIEEIYERTNSYQKANFINGHHWFLYEKKELIPAFKQDDVDLNIIEISLYGCVRCLKMNDLVYNYYKFGNFKKQKMVFSKLFTPITYFKGKEFENNDFLIYLTLEELVISFKEIEELNKKILFDSTYNKLNLKNLEELKKWLKKQGYDAEKFEKIYFDNSDMFYKFSQKFNSILKSFKIKTAPMLLINNRYVLLNNAVVLNGYYDEDLSYALLDYISILALLEKMNLIEVTSNAISNNNPPVKRAVFRLPCKGLGLHMPLKGHVNTDNRTMTLWLTP